MTYSIITILFVVFGCIYLYRRSKNKTSLPQILMPKSKETQKLSIDEAFNLSRSQKEAELDELLDKINKKGYKSLSEKEKEMLKELSK